MLDVVVAREDNVENASEDKVEHAFEDNTMDAPKNNIKSAFGDTFGLRLRIGERVKEDVKDAFENTTHSESC